MTTWHASSDTLVRFARSPEELDEITASSIEQHLITCDACRSVVSGAADRISLQQSWSEIADAIDQPRRTITERTLRRLGMPTDLARIVGATPGLRLAWLATTVLLAAAAIAVARGAGSDAPFLVLAPLVPLGSVALAFLPTEEPGGEADSATPMYGAGLVIRRTFTVLVPTFAILAIAGLTQPNLTAGSAAWMLPGLALTLGSLALGTYVRINVATTALAVGWVVILMSVRILDGRQNPMADTAVFGPLGQVGALALILLAGAGLYLRRERFSTMEVSW